MASVKVKLDLKTTESAIKQLNDFSKILGQGAEFLRGRVIRNWGKAKSPDGSTFRSLSTKAHFFNVGTSSSPRYMTFEGGYKQYKEATGRKGIRDLTFTGRMINGFKVFKKHAFKYVLGFTAPEKDKARGNNARTPNMLKVSSKLEKLVTKFVNKTFWKGVKK
jgi:hypothetical protein